MLFNTGLKVMSNRLPKVISPRTHAILDYATAGLFLAAGAMLWRRNRSAAVAAFTIAAQEVATAMLTDYPGGVSDVLSFETHGKIDASTAPVIAALPSIMDFDEDQTAANVFRSGAIMAAAVTGMTDFEGERGQGDRRRAA